MSRMDELVRRYARYMADPWPRTVTGAQRVTMVVYDKARERQLRAHIDDFAQATRKAHRCWSQWDCTQVFSRWLANHEYRDAYFERPDDLALALDTEFAAHAASLLREQLHACGDGVLGLTGAASLYGFASISDMVRAVEPDIQGRLVVFFPGSKEGTNYRFLDARDGWNYLAYSIVMHGGGGVL